MLSRILLVLVALALAFWFGERLYRSVVLTADTPRAIAPRGDLAEIERHTIALFESAAPSTVQIVTQGSQPAVGGTGSGFVWDAAGHVVTNFHVVQNAARVAVRLGDGEIVAAEVVGVAPDHDLAVLRLGRAAGALRPLPIGASADLRVGQSVYAIGNPFGLSRSLSTGIISALDRKLPTASHREIAGVIQTDAAINPGNSGGPLLDSAGRLIGVNTAILSGSGAFAGIGFAVPVDTVNRVVPALIRDGRVPRPGIGIAAAPEEMTARLDAEGLVIAEVLPDSAAARAGLQGWNPRAGALGDVILRVNGEPVQTIAEFASALEQVGIGNEARLTVRREGRTREVAVTVTDIGR